MAVGWPTKTTYANGDVYSASDVNDTNGTLNLLGASVAYAAGKNKIINGDFNINQRAFTSNTTSGLFNFDRWYQLNSGGSFTVTPQTFTPGAAPVSGYEGRTFLQGITASQSAAGDYAILTQKIESVRTLAGQTATISFWAKASSGTPKVALEVGQSFGTGGSPSSQVLTNAGAVTISTSWARYSVTISVPSISSKTIGTTANTSDLRLNLWLSSGSDYNSRNGSLGIQNSTFQIWGVQVEAGSVATPFTTATGTIQGELAACQRYYFLTGKENAYSVFGHGIAYTTTQAYVSIIFPVTMRTAPTVLDYSTVAGQGSPGGSTTAATNLTINTANTSSKIASLTITVGSGLWTSAYPATILANNSTSGYVGLSAEL
jgi:hypothetical protein